MISERDMKILTSRISFLKTRIDWHEDKLVELKEELKDINEIIESNV
jgi:hypothetical protein